MDDTRVMFQLVLLPILLQIPALLLMLAGVILALIYWRQNAKVSLLVIVAMMLLLAVSVSSMLQRVLLPFLIDTQWWVSLRISRLTSCLGIVLPLLNAVALGLLLRAAFGWRKKADTEIESSA